MAVPIRTTITGVGQKYSSKEPGTRFGLSLNTFGLKALEEISGDDLVPIMLKAIQPAFDEAKAEWPVITQASRDSMDITVVDVGPKNCRVALQIGGERLIEDPRNKSKKDYAPYVEYNGTPKTPPGTITRAMIVNEDKMKAIIREGVQALIQERLRG